MPPIIDLYLSQYFQMVATCWKGLFLIGKTEFSQQTEFYIVFMFINGSTNRLTQCFASIGACDYGWHNLEKSL
jgi:hypothetical protein